MKKLSLIAALTLSTMLSACGGGGGHGGHVPSTTLPTIPENPGTETNACSLNPETCMTTAKISAQAVNEYLSQQVESAEKETAAASYSLKSRARAKAASSNDTMESRVKSAYTQMKALLIDSVSEKDDEVMVNRAENEVELKKSLLLAGYSVSDLNGIENLTDWADTNALTIKRKAEQTYDMYFDKKGNLKEVGMENAKLTMVNIGEKQDSYVNFLVDKSGKITGLHFDVSSDSADSRGVDFKKTADGEFKRNGLILAYRLRLKDVDKDLYLESFEELNLGQLKKRLRAKLAEEGYDNTSKWEKAINNLNANDLKAGGNSDKGLNIGGLKAGNRDAFIAYSSKGSDIDGKGTNLLYSDFGTVHVNSWEGEEDKIDETFVFAGGYEAKRITPEQLSDKEMEFEGKAVAALIYQYPNLTQECEGDRCEKSAAYDGTAKLVFAKGNETLTAKFDKWYDVTVKSNGNNYDINFSDKNKNIEEVYKFTDDTVKNGVTGFVGTAENDSHYGAVDIGYYGDKGNPSEATGYVAYGEVVKPGTNGNSSHELHSQIGFGTQRTK